MNPQSLKRNFVFAVILAGTAFNCAPHPAQASWQKPAQPPAAEPLTAVLAHPFKGGSIIAASGHQVFSKNSAGIWKSFSYVSAAPVEKLLYLKEIPPKVSLNEAVDLAKKFGDTESGRFVNGVLDRISKVEGDLSKKG